MLRRFDPIRFLGSEDGGITALSLQMFLGAVILGGLAVDVGNAVANKTHLLVAADAAAHAALLTREWHSEADATQAAIDMAKENMSDTVFGNVLSASDIQFGTWNAATATFTPSPGSRDAVQVSTKRYAANNNGVATYMLGLVGLNRWDVASATVFETYYPTCFREGFVAQDRVDMQSNSYYKAGFCIHSQTHVEVSSNNTFEPGVVVSMPDARNVVLPNSGFTSNTGLQPALRDGSYNIKIINRIDSIIAGVNSPNHVDYGVMTPSSPYYRSYITSATPVTVKTQGKTVLNPNDFKTGRIHVMTCKNDNTHKQMGAGFTLKNMVVITDCRIQIASGAVLEDAVIISTNTDAKSIYASSDIQIGKDDHCGLGGDVQIVTKGGIEFASQVNIFGSQLLAAGDISLTANANGIEGASIVAGGKLDVTSNGTFGFCGGNGMNNNYEAAYFRLVR
jgi:Flp pilus assembly protein TadG